MTGSHEVRGSIPLGSTKPIRVSDETSTTACSCLQSSVLYRLVVLSISLLTLGCQIIHGHKLTLGDLSWVLTVGSKPIVAVVNLKSYTSRSYHVHCSDKYPL